MSLTSFRAFKIAFALYISIIWLELLPFSDHVLKSISKASLHPNPIWNWFIQHNLEGWLIGSLSLSGLLLLNQKTIRLASLYLLINWIFLYQQMPFAYFPPPGMFIGWLFVWFIFNPQDELTPSQRHGWWFILMVGYFVSGLLKTKSQLWIDGEAINLLSKSLMMKSSMSFLQTSPLLCKFLTYSGLILELSGILIMFIPFGKRLIWYCYLTMHIWILFCFNVPEVGLFFLIFNLALWDEKISFFPKRKNYE